MVAFEGVGKRLGCVGGVVAGGRIQDRTIVLEKIHSLSNMFTAGRRNVAPVAPIMFVVQPKVPSVRAFAVPQSSVVGGVVNYYTTSWWCQGRLVVVKRAVDVVVGRNLGVEAVSLEEIQR